MSELMTTAELASVLGVHPQTLYQWRKDGKGPRYIKIGKTVRYSAADLDEFFNSRTTDDERNPVEVTRN